MAVSESSLRFAVQNVAEHGDTDVFPFPLENHWFHDAEDDVVGLLQDIDRHFDDRLGGYPVAFVRNLAAVGYAGFRAVTQIDPLWNAYLLALTLEIAPEIESARIAPERAVVFSYRFKIDPAEHTLFDPALGWMAFQRAALSRAVPPHHFVITTDISDFYPRVYHHRLGNALSRATANTEVVRRIMAILARLAIGGVSYGLPVGGHAARLLAELLLNSVDRLLLTSSVPFCRFVDDYVLFTESREGAQRALVMLSEMLNANEGLTLSRAKTRVMTLREYIRSSPIAEPEVAESEDEARAREFLRIRLAFDPYSPTADEDYEQLSQDLERFDVLGMLALELRKSRIDEALTRQLVKSIRFLKPGIRDAAVLSVVRNLGVLYPVFPTVAIAVRQLLPDVSEPVQAEVFGTLRGLLRDGSHITMVATNASFAMRILAHDKSEETDALLNSLFSSVDDMGVRRDIILAMARRGSVYWLSDAVRRLAPTATPWERRAFIVASYVLGDEGRHWRNRVRGELSEVDRHYEAWVASKNAGRVWEIPL